MLVWSGRGILIPIVFFITFISAGYLLAGPEGPNAEAMVLSPALLLTAIFSYHFGMKWNKVEGQTLVDKNTGQEFIIKPNHSFFFVKMEYWGYIFFILGVIALVSIFL